VNITDIPDFPGLPGQRPTPGTPDTVTPVAVVLVTAPLDAEGTATPINAAAVDAFITAEVSAGRAYTTTVERWAPWSPLDVALGYGVAVGYNYGRFTIGGRSFYAYVSAEYQNLTTTTLVPESDDWTTYAPTIGYSTVKRGHVAVAASQSDTYGDQYMTAPEPVDAPPTRSVLDAGILDAALSSWRVVVVCANDLRGDGETPYFAPHVSSADIVRAHNFASDATAASGGGVQVEVPAVNYPWLGGAALDGAFYWPFEESTFNMNNGRPEDNFRTAARPTHKGMDMGYGVANIEGTPVRAIGDGYVTTAGDNADGYGNRVVITHPNGYRSTYNHMNATPTVTVGESVVAAKVLGGIGTTGDSTGNHLHFEIYEEAISDYIDPLAFMAEYNPLDLIVGTGLPGSGQSTVYVPKVTPSPVSTIDGVTVGGGVYTFTMDGYAAFLTIMQGAPWVLNGIVSTAIVPAWSVPGAGDGVYTPVIPPTSPSDPKWATVAAIPNYIGKLTTGATTASALNGWRTTVAGSLGLGVYRKLLTSQFTRIMVSDGDTEHDFSPEVWKSADISFGVVTEATHGIPSIRAIPNNYTALGEQKGITYAFGGTQGLAFSGRASAAGDTAQQDMGPWLAAYSATTSRYTLREQQDLALLLARENVQMALGVQGIQVVLGAAGGLVGGAAGVAKAGATGLANLATSTITANNSLELLDISQDGSIDIAAYQLGLSGIANYYSFDAWAQSLDSASGGGGAHSLAGAWRAMLGRALDVMIVTPTADAVARALSTWKRYGYMIDRAFVPPRLDAMDRFTYWQLEDPTILGAMPAAARARIADRFTRGTTIWTAVSEIGTNPANTPRPGVSY